MVMGFDKENFMRWLLSTLPQACDNEWTAALVENVIDWAIEHEHVSRDQVARWLSRILPDVTFEQVAGFCEDGILTDGTLAALGRK